MVAQIREDTGIANTEAMERILEWFTGLDRKFRLAILNNDPATRAELARLTLSEMAVGDAAGVDLSKPPSSYREVIAAQRKLLELAEQMGASYEEHIARSKRKKG
jgi:hypothetical protein